MKKKILLFMILLALSISLSDAIKIITVNETDLVNLKPKAIDEDADILSYTFTPPLDENGQWQTKYGDAGEYDITVTVSDGQSSTSRDVLLVVNKRNVAPTIDSFAPQEPSLTIDEGNSIDFSITASDLNKDQLIYTWNLDNKKVSEDSTYNYKADYGDAGTHKIISIVSDGEAQTEKEWTIDINKVDRKALLDNLNDITVAETDIVKLPLPDFKKYNLDYTISEPIGNSNIWQTTYNDAGAYDVTITIKDRQFLASKTIKVTVKDKDRLPSFTPIETVWMQENQKATINLEASDPDNDKIEFSAGNLPEGATLKNNVFEWTTNYDTVKKDNIIEKIVDKFHLLYRPVRITFTTKSNGAEAKQSVLIMVKDINRPPILNEIQPITVNEGEIVSIKPEANEPDGDSISYSYSGWINKDSYTTKYGDAGEYKVKVTASDGFLTDEKYATVIVKHTDRAPIFGDIPKIEINENEKLELSIPVSDPDGDLIGIIAEPLPKNALIEDDKFVWTPDYETVKDDSAVFSINFIANDGELQATKEVNITVNNKNRPPKIISAAPKKDAAIYKNEAAKFNIAAEDPDGDTLTYTWKFGLLEKYIAGSTMVRKFTTIGAKDIEVIVSDGKEEANYKWDVKVVEKKIAVKKVAAK